MEWTQDCWNDSNNGNPGDGSARTTGYCIHRVLRGGSWIDSPRALRAAIRAWDLPGVHFHNNGFRVARTLSP